MQPINTYSSSLLNTSIYTNKSINSSHSQTILSPLLNFYPLFIMSDKCSSCNCGDKSQCGKGNNYGLDIVETDKSYDETMIMEVPELSENDGNCKCGTSCECSDCKCSH